MQENKIALFEEKEIRRAWYNEDWYFSVEDVVQILTDSVDVKQYIKKLKAREPELNNNWGTICTLVEMIAKDGKKRKVRTANTKGILRIIQSIPSPKAEPFKMWMAQVAKERLDEMQDPEQGIHRALAEYKALGYSDNWINQRLKSIEIRKDLTDEWKKHGLKEGVQFATLTDIIYKTWAGKTAKQYKEYKGLKKENLRDNMTNQELVLNMLAEMATTDISKARNPQNFTEHADTARRGGSIAKEAREKLELETGKKIVSPLNAKDYFDQQQKIEGKDTKTE